MSDSNKIPSIVIVDYGVGNLHSLVKAFRQFGITPIISEDPTETENADGIVLPGVGSFEGGMQGLAMRNLGDAVKNFAVSGKPIIGICLGAQLLFEKGYEFGEHDGLGIIAGRVVEMPRQMPNVKLPHIGWNTIQQKEQSWNNTIFHDLGEKPHVYFVHSFILEPTDQQVTLATTTYGGHEFVSAVQQNNIFGCQFHPEKSGEIGLSIIKNFIQIVSSEQ